MKTAIKNWLLDVLGISEIQTELIRLRNDMDLISKRNESDIEELYEAVSHTCGQLAILDKRSGEK